MLTYGLKTVTKFYGNASKVTISGREFDRNSAYISFNRVYAKVKGHKPYVGKVHSGSILPIASSRVNSLRRDPNWFVDEMEFFGPWPRHSFNWADLNP